MVATKTSKHAEDELIAAQFEHLAGDRRQGHARRAGRAIRAALDQLDAATLRMFSTYEVLARVRQVRRRNQEGGWEGGGVGEKTITGSRARARARTSSFLNSQSRAD